MKAMKDEEAIEWKKVKQKKRKTRLRNTQANVSAPNRDIYEDYM